MVYLKNKHLKISLVLILILAFLNRCTRKCECSEYHTNLLLIAFSPQETDTIIIRRYLKGSHFSTLKDSFTLNKTNSFFYQRHDSLKVGNTLDGMGFTGRDDYGIYLPSSGILKKLEMDVEFLNGICGRCFNLLHSYKVDGQSFPILGFNKDISALTNDAQILIHK